MIHSYFIDFSYYSILLWHSGSQIMIWICMVRCVICDVLKRLASEWIFIFATYDDTWRQYRLYLCRWNIFMYCYLCNWTQQDII